MIDRLSSLVGEDLNGVGFVMDYVELMFNGPVIRCISNPVVSDGKSSWRFPEPGSRDGLCGLIGTALASVNFEPEHSLTLNFGGERLITVSLEKNARHSGEAVHYVAGPNQPIDVW